MQLFVLWEPYVLVRHFLFPVMDIEWYRPR